VDLQPGDADYEKVRRSLDEFGCVEPLVWNRRTGNLVGGHQRLKVLLAQGQTEVEVSVVDLSPEKEKALNLALNKAEGRWDEAKLAALLDELVKFPDFDVALTGFDPPEVEELLARLAAEALADREETFDPDAVLADKGEPVTRRGEVVELGPHRLMCGDATKRDDVAALMAGRQAHLVFTDPPYAVNYIGGRFGEAWRHKVRQDGERYWDHLSRQEYCALLRSALTHAHNFTDNKCPLYLWFASMRVREVLRALAVTKWRERALLIWAKNTFAGSLSAQYKYAYEPFWYGHKRGQSPRWHGPTNEVTVWQCAKPQRNEGHPTVKPLELAERAIRNSSRPGQTVLDLFLGSGTTLVAAAKMGRRCYGMEIEPRYCDVAIRRHIGFVGEGAVDAALAARYRRTQEEQR
jgi:DNA modification methylase